MANRQAVASGFMHIQPASLKALSS